MSSSSCRHCSRLSVPVAFCPIKNAAIYRKMWADIPNLAVLLAIIKSNALLKSSRAMRRVAWGKKPPWGKKPLLDIHKSKLDRKAYITIV